MSIASKHAYRFGYLKSDKWKIVRLEALVREGGKCEICKEESIYNDAHHIWYPKSIYDTTPDHLAILCRTCHDFIHVMLPECKTKDEAAGKEMWLKFKTAIISWRTQKIPIFTNPEGIEFLSLKQMREEVIKVTQKLYNKCGKGGVINMTKSELGMMLSPLKNYKIS